ncbi:hypothetical protein ACFQ6N_11010 [Kitasatospora sp. NPDC056446]|uniref:hypothetical protein n=1 Tax=Kitasatospora sp. NPDC056446 TaxID=3345819 RepID=UPI00369EC80B
MSCTPGRAADPIRAAVAAEAGSGGGAVMESQCGPRGVAEPADREVRWVHQPVEVDLGDGTWALGRISGWWQDGSGRSWCRLRVTRSGQPPNWERYDPERVLLLPVSGL